MTRVLIVDDKEENLRYLDTLLSRQGYTVDSAHNGEEALASARQVLPDLVISDLLMPVMDGYTFLRRWKSDTTLRQIPFIVYTATFTKAEDRRYAQNLGADAFILKPVRATELLARMHAVLATAAIVQPLDSTPVEAEKTTLKYYSEALVRKLEEKSQQLELANQSLLLKMQEDRQTDEAIRFNNTILQTQQQSSLDAILVVSEAGKVLSYNDQVIELWEVPKELFEACREIPMLQSPAIIKKIRAQLKNPDKYLEQIKYLRTHPHEKSLLEVPFNNGKIIELYSAPAIGPDEHFYGRVWYYRDITERRRAKAALEASAQEQRQLAELLEIERSRLLAAQQIARIGSWETDLATMSVIWSEQMHRIFETDPIQFHPTHASFLEFVHPDERTAVDDSFKDSLAQHGTNRIEHRLLLADGRIKSVEEHWQVFRDSAGKPARALGACHDISEQKAAAEEIYGLGNRLIETLESISDAFFTLDHAWRFTYVNAQAEQLLQRSRLDLLGSNIWKEFREAKILFEPNYTRAMTEQVTVAFEEYYAPLNTWFEINVCPSAEGLAVYFRDVTERKATQAQLAYLNRVRAVFSGISALIISASNREELFREACHIAYKAGEFRMVMLCMVDPSTQKIAPVASEGKDEALLAIVRNTLSIEERASDTMVARAIRTNSAIVSNDCRQDPQVLFSDKYLASGVQSLAVLPLRKADHSIGALVLYAHEIDFFQQHEMSLLSELADDIAFAVDNIEKQERLDYLANFDTLTGLANRELFVERLGQHIDQAASGGYKLCICLNNLERFKNINDTLGRASGDALLRLVAEWLIRNAGDANIVGRIGADQFAVVFKLRPEGNLIKLFESLTRAFMDTQFTLNDTTLRIAAKAGIALFPDDGTDADTLFRNAEAALKETRSTNERFMFYTKSMNIAVAARLMLENQLRQATSTNEFELYYQPKIQIASGRIIGAEALIRWNDPQGNLVLPGKFIPILEETGMIADVGRWALSKAIDDHLRWRKAGLPAVRIAVNISPLQLNNRNFIADVESRISIDKLAVEGLELEITESVIMENIKSSTTSLQAIRAMGIPIAIDDFGTGFSSLSYLAKLPVDSLKIDRSFVLDMTSGAEGLALVSTIIGLAHALNLKVVAEGVETEEQARLLRLLKCDEIQGYLISHPLPADEFEQKFLRGSMSRQSLTTL